jgi:uncharacterized protein YjbI with pentapeptide repeats
VLTLSVPDAIAACTDAAVPEVQWRRCLLDGSDLSGADLSGGDLRDTSLKRANLTGANLSGIQGRSVRCGVDPGRLHQRRSE